jgi:hypothetical protein
VCSPPRRAAAQALDTRPIDPVLEAQRTATAANKAAETARLQA